MNDYSTPWESLINTIGAPKGHNSGEVTDQDHLSTDQRLKVAEVAALLSIAQEISALNPQNISSKDKDGNARHGWGVRIYD